MSEHEKAIEARRETAENEGYAATPMDIGQENRPAVGAPKNWPHGYLACGCRNDGEGRHVR